MDKQQNQKQQQETSAVTQKSSKQTKGFLKKQNQNQKNRLGSV